MPDTAVGNALLQLEVSSMPSPPISRRVVAAGLAALVMLAGTGCGGFFEESDDSLKPPPGPTPTARLPASSFSGLHDYQFVRMSDTTWRNIWAELESCFEGALASGEGRTVKDTDGTIIGVAVVATPAPGHATPSALYGLIDAQEERAYRLERPTFRQSIGGQGVLHVSDGEVARWYWISGTDLVAVTTDRRQDGRRFVEAFATHTL